MGTRSGFTAMHFSDVVGIVEAGVGDHVYVEGHHYIVVGFANGVPSNLVLRRKFGHKVFLAIRRAGEIVMMLEVKNG